jgi:hypothetical protein
MGDGRIFMKTSAPLSLMTIYQMTYFQPDPSRWAVPSKEIGCESFKDKTIYNNLQKAQIF